MKELLNNIVSNDYAHAKWLNTLSLMENCGARKISACEDFSFTNIIQLKHAAEEHRHAYYLKKQLQKLGLEGFERYTKDNLLAGFSSMQYLNRLDVSVSRYLKNSLNLQGIPLKYASYLFVTYAIELRADELYPIYQEVLSAHESKVVVKSIILEEEGHLEEMISQLKEFSKDWEKYANEICALEQDLFQAWTTELKKDIPSGKIKDDVLVG
ncbi:hypothetical protein ACFRAE_16905 [Sphingobacterium sp. HJSM2_6]|uniref:hypothetical protein n=1 Tax=Sphingobacterium sp. HJSM2_6 TaxID=3366264 RepID=UPI003BD2C438